MYQPSQFNWSGRVDSTTDHAHFRNFQVVEQRSADDLTSTDISILGYAVDKGVELNQGRTGAVDGPDAIRSAFANLPVFGDLKISDYGDVTHSGALIDTQNEYGSIASTIIENSAFTFLIGGGHDISYAHYVALRTANPSANIGVINIDAHFDTRQADGPTSGTGFRQMLESGEPVDYMVLGIQRAGNTQVLFDYAVEKNIRYIMLDDLHEVSDDTKTSIQDFIDTHDIILLTLCMDVIDSAYAPGVSAAAVLGMTPQVALQLMKLIASSNKTKAISIAEMNPKFDVDNRTAKLIAHFMHHLTYLKVQ